MTTADTLHLEPGATSKAGRAVVRADAEASVDTQAMRERRVPLTMPSSQEYYWHFEWQQGEREAQAEREAGDVVRFDSDDPEDIVRWLHEDDDE